MKLKIYGMSIVIAITLCFSLEAHKKEEPGSRKTWQPCQHLACNISKEKKMYVDEIGYPRELSVDEVVSALEDLNGFLGCQNHNLWNTHFPNLQDNTPRPYI
jgi:hypothetical protein